MKFRIDFAQHSRFESLGFRISIVGVVLVLLSSALLTTLKLTNRDVSAQVSELQVEIGKRQAPPAPPPVLSAEEQQSIRRASLELSIEWGRLLNAIEEAHTNTITLMGIEAEAPGASLRLIGTGQHYADVLEFVEHLQNREVLYDVLLTSHQASSEAPDSPIKFVITARWRLT
jgi:hypothetical protein